MKQKVGAKYKVINNEKSSMWLVVYDWSNAGAKC